MGYFNSEELFHSETYLGADYSDGLQHFKYIRRYRNRKGKWTYVYANKGTHNQIVSDLRVAEMHRSDEKSEKTKSDNSYKRYEFYKKHGDIDLAEKALDSAKWEDSIARLHSGMADDHEVSAYASIQKNSVSELSEKAINNGKEAIRRVFKQLFNVKRRH